MKSTGTVLLLVGIAVILYFGFLLPVPESVSEVSGTGGIQEVIHWGPYFGILLVLAGIITLVINSNQKDEKTLFTEDPAD